MSTELRPRIDQMNATHPALAEHHGALHAGGPGADHEHVVVGVLGSRELLRVPAAPVLFAARRVLCAPDRRSPDLPARDADVAADAFADVVEAALLDLPREKGIGDGGTGGADDVALAGADHLDHEVWVREPADVHHRLACDGLREPRVRRLVIRLEEARRGRVLAEVHRADVDVPVVDELVECRDELDALLARANACVAEPVRLVERVDGKATADRTVVDLVADLFEDLAREANAALEGAAVLVRPLVEERVEEEDRHCPETAVQRQQIEACRSRPLEAFDVLAAQLADLAFRHRAPARHVVELARDLRDDPVRMSGLFVRSD